MIRKLLTVTLVTMILLNKQKIKGTDQRTELQTTFLKMSRQIVRKLLSITFVIF